MGFNAVQQRSRFQRFPLLALSPRHGHAEQWLSIRTVHTRNLATNVVCCRGLLLAAQFGGMHGYGQHGNGSFESRYRCYSVACVDKVCVATTSRPSFR
jgi:hypothetical protein